MKLNFREVKNIDIISYLEQIGIRPVRNYSGYALFHAPYREDRHPSFKVSRKKNRWYDLATFASGDILDLGKLIYNTDDIVEVFRRIQNYTSAKILIKETPAYSDTGEQYGKFKNVTVNKLTNERLLSYLGTRGIDLSVATEYCKEIHFTLGARPYYGLGFENVRKGYEIRNSFFKGCLGPKDISWIPVQEQNKDCTVFEGFMDFLSYLTLSKRAEFCTFTDTMDFIVLNSVSNLQKAMRWLEPYQTVTCCLDNDDAGRRAVDILGETRDGIYDVSEVYKGFKDLNDFLRGKRF